MLMRSPGSKVVETIAVLVCLAHLTLAQGASGMSTMKERVARVKKSIVRVLVGGRPIGSGFVVSNDGLIATCFHVVQHAQATPDGKTQIGYADGIEVQFVDGTKLTAIVDERSKGPDLPSAVQQDYAILRV